MDISPIFRAVAAPGQERAFQQLADLRPGQRLIGRVLRIEDDGRVLIDLGKMQVLARSEIPLAAGQEIPLRVMQAGMIVRLRLDGEPVPRIPQAVLPFAPAEMLSAEDKVRTRQIIAQLLRNSPDLSPADASGAHGQSGAPVSLESEAVWPSILPEAVRNALQRINRLFEPMDPAAPSAHQAQWLRTAIENSGLLFERKLADALVHEPIESRSERDSNPAEATSTPPPHASSLQTVRQVLTRDMKAQLLVLKRFFGDVAEQTSGMREWLETGDAVHMRRIVAHLLAHIEQHQQQAVRHAGDNAWFQVFGHIIPLKEHARAVRLKVYYPKKGLNSGNDHPSGISLLLDMDRLGPVRADLTMMDRRLSIVFYVHDSQVRNIFEPCTRSVKSALEEWFEQIQISTHVSRQKIVRFDDDDRPGGLPAQGVDLRA